VVGVVTFSSFIGVSAVVFVVFVRWGGLHTLQAEYPKPMAFSRVF
jgi:hypothetical protein|tara:strand:- start:109283 stop:109417 length:135 start_codon:yes stop_codon:yes gene_type:complete